MKIHEVLDRDPRARGLANSGQARIDGGGDQARSVLREELESFVCDGRFGDALQRILDRYLANLGSARQDAAWISGFFGSGKSHLLKMAAHLWVNTKFEDGATARGLVGSTLPEEVRASLLELDTQATRIGQRPVAAAGTLLGGNARVRLTVLQIILRACDWPGQYPQARFCFWLQDHGALDAVQAAVKAEGRDWQKELNSLLVSPSLARAAADAVPGFPADVKSALAAFRSQFPTPQDDITTEEFVDAARRALAGGGALPPTILVLDEVQQYIGAEENLSSTFTELAEALQTRFDGRVMLVGAGQSALSADTPYLAKLRDRFIVKVELTDADVEAVTRQVLLGKKPSAVPEIERLFETHAGEVARHLQGTRLAGRREDRRHQVEDYPLLPVRRRFWEACFRAVDSGGAHSQLRSQLRILHDSLKELAQRDLGATIPASDLFDALAPDMVSTGVLLSELDTRIRELDDGTKDGTLRRALCGLVFLCGKLPREEAVDTGVRATAPVLADLMVEDITHDASGFRHEVTMELDALAERGVLLKVGEEYRLQTTEGAEWDRAWREQVAAGRQDEPEIARIRHDLLASEIEKVVRALRPVHGDSKQRRGVKLHAGEDEPPPDGEALVVWWRDGWSAAQRNVENAARLAGVASPVLFVHLPQRNANDLRDRILAAWAARRVLDRKGHPTSPEGQEARSGIESRLAEAEQRRGELVQDVLRAARVYQGGGAEVHGDALASKLERGGQASLARLFPEFEKADHGAWERALRYARDGNDSPLKVVGWMSDTVEHPVPREVLARVVGGMRGTDLHRELRAAPYGWPQDAVDAVLVALHRSGHLRATRNGAPVAPGQLVQGAIKTTEFRPERVVLTAGQRIKLRGLFQQAGIQSRSGEEEQAAREFLGALRRLAERAGGDPPLPPVPASGLVADLGRLVGPEQLAGILEEREGIGRSIEAWRERAKLRERREPRWALARDLRRHAEGLPAAGALEPEFLAIEGQRSLLEDADQLAPLAGRLTGLLRTALTDRRQALADRIAGAVSELEDDTTWCALEPDARREILGQCSLVPPANVPISTPEELLSTLDQRPLDAWQAEVDAVPERASRALAEAARRAHGGEEAAVTTSVAIRRGTLADEAAVRAWLREQEARLLEAVRKGPVVLR